jgi:hypothetical protein
MVQFHVWLPANLRLVGVAIYATAKAIISYFGSVALIMEELTVPFKQIQLSSNEYRIKVVSP